MSQLSYILMLSWRSVRSRWVQSVATVVVVGMALALFVAVSVLGDGVRVGITQASDPFGTLVIGPKGDAQQLVLNTILLNGNPIGTIEADLFEMLENDPRANLVIPIGMADNVGGARIIGTTTDFFSLQPSIREASPFQIASGRYFEDLDLHDDHAGSDSHSDEHAEDEHAEDEHAEDGHEDEHVEAGEHHDDEHVDEDHADEHAEDADHHDEVTEGDDHDEHAEDDHVEEGEHAEVGEHHDDEHVDEDHADEHAEDADHHDEATEGDDHDEHAEADEHGHEGHSDEPIEAVLGATAAAGLGLAVGQEFLASHGTGRVLNADVHADPYIIVGILEETNTAYDSGIFVPLASVWEAHADGSHSTGEADTSAEAGELTAILVKPVTFADANAIWRDFYVSDNAQAAFPGEQLSRLFNTFEQLENILRNVGYVAAIMAGLTIFLAIYSATVAREQLIAVMRGVGAGRGVVLGMVLVEAVLVALLGALLARLLGYGTAWLLANTLSVQNGIPIPIRYVFGLEPLLWLLPIGLGLLAGAIPALLTYRVNVVDKLFAS